MSNQRDDFANSDRVPNYIRRQEYFLAQSRMEEALKWPYRGVDSPSTAQPTGSPAWFWQATGRSLSWENINGYSTLSTVNVYNPDFFVLPSGGPFVDLDGSTEYLYYTAAGWQSFGTNTALVWFWFSPATIGGAAVRVMIGKYLAAGNQRSWRMFLNAGDIPGCQVSSAGTAITESTLLSGYGAVSAGSMYFMALFFDPGTLQKLYVAEVGETELTETSLAVGVAAGGFASAADFMIGANGQTGVSIADYYDGRFGVSGYWQGIPTTDTLVDAWANWLFHWTKPAYGG